MCGIAGLYHFGSDAPPVSEALLTRMRDVMVHRGPDGGSNWISSDRRVGLAHRRLSIIDLSTTADQPMGNDAGSIQLVFNGEIYNHAEIRAELDKTGKYRWKTDHSDTEVLLRAYEEWGLDCLHRFRGMFAIALWDARDRSLWLVRDRIGVKPLYYTIRKGRLAFASEIKALLQDPLCPRRVNEEAMFHYLSFLTTPAPQTLFEGVSKLEAGTWLRVKDGHITERRYWDVWDHAQPLTGLSEDDITERVRETLREAVKLRKVSDVPVGVFLSGGIDSSTNAALFSEGESRPIKTFTVGYNENYGTYKNETHFARQMAETVGADHHEILLSQEDLVSFLPQMIHLQDEPLGDPVCFPVYFVSKLARDNGVIVCQVGEGSDELFWGYGYWKTMLRLQNLNDRTPLAGLGRMAAKAALSAAGKTKGPPYELLRRASLGQPIFWGGADIFNQSQKQRLLSPRLRKKFDGFTSWEALRPHWDRFQANAWEPSALHWMSYCDLKLRLPELLLMRVDKMSMGVSLECRVPFLDHKFVELALSIPSELKTRDRVSKGLLKKAVRGLIPDNLIDRPKQGFGVPVYEWLFGALGDHARSTIKNFCEQTDFLDPNEATALVDNHHGAHAWYILNLALWWEQYIGQVPSALAESASTSYEISSASL